MLLGFSDLSIGLAYILTLISALICVAYGLKHWNDGGEISPEELAEEERWLAGERDLERDLADGGRK